MKQQLTVQVQLLNKDAKLPTQSYEAAAGWDLYANETKRVPGHGKTLIKTGLAFAFPKGYYGQLKPRSGIALKTPLMLDAGVIDEDYRGEVSVIIVNTSDYPTDVERGTKLVQMTIEKKNNVTMTEVKELPVTERNEKGFGSSDK